MSPATDARRLGHAAARVLAVAGGILLSVSAAISYFVAGYADDALDAATGAGEDALKSGETGLDPETADDAADWLHRLSDWLVGGSPDQFRDLALVAIAAGVVAVVAALPRRPEAVWPELAWGATAIAGLAPNLAFDLWFSIWVFTGGLVAAAAVAHYLARRDDHVRRAAAATRRAGVAAAPHVQSALGRGSRAATDALARARAARGPTAAPVPTPAPVPRAPVPAPAPMPAPPSAATPAAIADAPPAGWYDDPRQQARLRYWDGSDWTPHTS